MPSLLFTTVDDKILQSIFNFDFNSERKNHTIVTLMQSSTYEHDFEKLMNNIHQHLYIFVWC